MTTVYMSVIVKAGQNIIEQVRMKFPNATLVDIVITNIQGDEFELVNLSSHTSTIDRIVMYRLDLRGEVSISRGENILNRVHEVFQELSLNLFYSNGLQQTNGGP